MCMRRWAISLFLFPFLYITAKALSHRVQDIFFSKALEEWKTKHTRPQWAKKVAGAPINHRDHLHTVLWPITASLEQEFHLDLPWLAPHPPKRYNNCKFICKVYGLPPQTCPFCRHEGNVWRNKWCWTLRRRMIHISMGADTAAQGQQPREGKILQAFRINYTLSADLRCATFRTFRFVSFQRSWQPHGAHSCCRCCPLTVKSLFLSSGLLRLCWLHLLMWAGRAGCAWLTVRKKRKQSSWMIKGRVHLPVTLAALFMLANDGFGILELHLTASLNTATINLIQLHPNTNLSEICFNRQHVCF